MDALNAWLDRVPRTRLFRAARERPAFLGMGVAGYYAALVVLFGSGLLLGRSLLSLASIAVACAASFFGWARLRRRFTGEEVYVLFEHVWIAELAAAGTLAALGEPVLPYLDLVSVALCVFLAAGRVGCLLVGCCHGQPASLGIRYGEACARDGFPAHLVGVRLFPVQALESAALLAIGAVGLLVAARAHAGAATSWVLLAYAVTRFGLEGLRGDERPHLLGLSQSRWMAIAEASFAVSLAEEGRALTAPRAAMIALIAGALIVLIVRLRGGAARAVLRPEHVAELRSLVRAAVQRGAAGDADVSAPPEVLRTSAGASVAASVIHSEREGRVAHVSLALPAAHGDVHTLCRLASRAVPELLPASGRLSPRQLLHVLVPLPLDPAPPALSDDRAANAPGAANALGAENALRAENALWGVVLRRLQASAGEATRVGDAPVSAPPPPEPLAASAPAPEADPPDASPWTPLFPEPEPRAAARVEGTWRRGVSEPPREGD